MTDAQRRDEIRKLIASYTAEKTITKDAARAALIDEGIYNEKGELRVEFGGKRKKTQKAA